MTIRIIRTASLGLPVGTFRTLAPATEAALVADKEAVYDGPQAGLAGPVTADASGNLFANGRQIQGSVSGAGRVNIVTFGAKPGRAVEDVETTIGSNQVSSATAAFTTADLGARFTLCDPLDYTKRVNGTITNVISETVIALSAVVTFSCSAANAPPNAAGMALGPDNADAIDAALAVLSVVRRQPTLYVPFGIYLTSRAFTLPDGTSIRGEGADYGLAVMPIGAGSALLLASSQGGGASFVNLGSATNAFTSGKTRSCMDYVAIDACNNADFAVTAQCRRGRIFESQIWRGREETLRITGQNTWVQKCTIGAQNNGNVVSIKTTDVKLLDCEVRQGGNPTASATRGHQIYVRMVDQMNVLISRIHFYSGFNALISSNYQGSNIMFHTPAGTATASIAATVNACLFDSTYGPQVCIRNEGSSRASQFNFAGNTVFQTTGFPDVTFPVIAVEPISSSIRGLTINGFVGNGAVNNFTAFLEQKVFYGGVIAGVLTGVSLNGNNVMNCNAFWKGLVNRPVHSGNVFTASSGITELKGENEGRAVFSGTGAQTVFVIPHGLAAATDSAAAAVVPTFQLTAGSAAASAAFSAVADGTNITVTFAVAPANAANNVALNWSAKL